MLYIKKQKDYWSDYFYVDILSSEYMIKRWDVYIWQWHALQIIDTDWSLAIISWIRWCELNWVDWHDTIWWTKFTNNPVKSIDNTYMPTSIWPDYQWKVTTTVIRDPDDPSKILSLHSKFLPMANYYNTACLAKTTSDAHRKELKKKWELEILPFKVRFGASGETVKLEMAQELPDGIDMEDVQFYVSEIF